MIFCERVSPMPGRVINSCLDAELRSSNAAFAGADLVAVVFGVALPLPWAMAVALLRVNASAARITMVSSRFRFIESSSIDNTRSGRRRHEYCFSHERCRRNLYESRHRAIQ